MAAPCRHGGHSFLKNKSFLRFNFEQFFGIKSLVSAEGNIESIIIPRKKTWAKDAVIGALAATVKRDPTAYSYQFQDDPYLSPRTSSEFKLFSLSQESGRSAAKYFVNNHPKFFTKDYAEPQIPCLMPETAALCHEEVSEEGLKEQISLRKVTASVNLYDQLLQSGIAVSVGTTHRLLDLLCFYGDSDPVQEEKKGEEMKKQKAGKMRKDTTCKWKENNAERIFYLLPERDTLCYSALIRGMVKHGAYAKAFSLYTDLQNNRLEADVHIFNSLILAAPEVREKFSDRWDLIAELLEQMKQQKVHPNLLTFNSVLSALRRCGYLAKAYAPQTLNEMKSLGIAPSLATYDHILAVFYKSASSGPSNVDVLQEVISELEGVSFNCQDPNDVLFFSSAMRICLDNKDLELGYKVQSLVEVGENWKLLGDSFQQSIYYGRFFNLLCMMEHVDVVLKWYKQIIPSVYYPNPQGLRDLLQALDTDSRLDLLPTIWKDIKTLGHDNKIELVEELLTLMSRDEHSPEVQESFVACALDVKRVFDSRPSLEWSPSSLSNITTLLLRSNKLQQAWEMLQLFKTKNRIPPQGIVNSFLSLCKTNGSSQRALELIQLSWDLSLPSTKELCKRTLTEFELTTEQKAYLTELEAATDVSE